MFTPNSLNFLFPFGFLIASYGFSPKNGVYLTPKRYYSGKPLEPKGAELRPVKTYSSAGTQKQQVLLENRGLTGIYRWVNKVTNKTYVGSGVDLSKRFAIYYRESELLKSSRPIHKALLKYGYDNFRLEILEISSKTLASTGTGFKAEIIKREQYYLDLLDPEYNILKVAYSLQGYKHTAATKVMLKANAVKRGVTVWVLNLASGEKFSFLTLVEAGEFLELSPTAISKGIKSGNLMKENFLVTTDENYSLDLSAPMPTKSKLTVLNTLTQEVHVFKNRSAVSQFLNVSRAAISMAIKSETRVKDLYLITDKNSFSPEVLAKAKILQVYNTQTAETANFINQTTVAGFLGISTSAVTQAIQGEYPVKGIYLITKKSLSFEKIK